MKSISLKLLCFVIGALMTCLYVGIRVNLSSSMPVGLYIKTNYLKVFRGDYVSACLSSDIAQEGMKRGYIGHGLCLDRSMPVVKRVIGIPGDRVTIVGNRIMINNTSYEAPRLSQDHKGRCMNPVTKGVRVLKAGQYWLYGENNFLHSWDSRYYGPLERNQIQGTYIAIHTTHPVKPITDSNSLGSSVIHSAPDSTISELTKIPSFKAKRPPQEPKEHHPKNPALHAPDPVHTTS